MTSRLRMTLQAVVPPPQELGAVPHGARVIAAITGGTFEGPRLLLPDRAQVRNERAAVCVLEPIDRYRVWRSPRERTDLHAAKALDASDAGVPLITNPRRP
jgi:hypothetical protein